MSNQAEDTPIETDESEAADSPAEHDERAHDESSGTSTSDLPQGAKDGELPPARDVPHDACESPSRTATSISSLSNVRSKPRTMNGCERPCSAHRIAVRQT